MAESRMYLPLAALVPLGVMAVRMAARRRSALILSGLALACGILTVRRNRDYASDLSIWRDTVAKCPASPRAHASLGVALFRHGDKPGALAEVAEAVRIGPKAPSTASCSETSPADAGRTPEAIAQYREALRLDPTLGPARAALRRLAP